MRAIWQFPLERVDEQTVTLPIGAKPLSVAMVGGDICIYFLVNSEILQRGRRVFVIGTGNPVPLHVATEADFIGTVVDSPFVWHIYVEAHA